MTPIPKRELVGGYTYFGSEDMTSITLVKENSLNNSPLGDGGKL